MQIPSFNEAEVPKAKITSYLLNLEHPEGASKARFFLSRGFVIEQWRYFADALRQQAVGGEVSNTTDGRFGKKFTIDSTIFCPDRSS